MVEFEQVSVDARLFAFQHRAVIDDLGREDVGVGEFLEPLLARLLREDLVEHFLDLLAVKIANHIVRIRRISFEVLNTDNLAERGPALLVYARDTDESVAGRERAPYAS